MRGGSVDLPDEMEKSQSSASTSPCLSPVRHAQVFPPLHPQHPQVIIFFCFISRSFVPLTLLLGLTILKYIYAANPCSISRSHTVCCPPISMSYSTTSRRAMPTNWISRRATRWVRKGRGNQAINRDWNMGKSVVHTQGSLPPSYSVYRVLICSSHNSACSE